MISAKEIIRKLPKEFQDTIVNESYLTGALDAAYNQPWRHYHNLDHVDRMLTDLIRIVDFSDEDISWSRAYRSCLDHMYLSFNAMVRAILFHDIVYVPGAPAKRNERESVKLMETLSPKIFCSQTCGLDLGNAGQLIMATTHDNSIETHAGCFLTDEFLISDLDMATFALPYDEFEKVNEKVRKELEMVFPEVQVTPGRIKFLKGLLSSKKIYYTNLFDEKVARNNIVTLLDKETKK